MAGWVKMHHRYNVPCYTTSSLESYNLLEVSILNMKVKKFPVLSQVESLASDFLGWKVA